MPIKKRTMFVDLRNDQVRFFDWCLVETTLGTMMEARQLNQISPKGVSYDPLDVCSKIDALQVIDTRKKYTFLGAGIVLQGGDQLIKSESY